VKTNDLQPCGRENYLWERIDSSTSEILWMNRKSIDLVENWQRTFVMLSCWRKHRLLYYFRLYCKSFNVLVSLCWRTCASSEKRCKVTAYFWNHQICVSFLTAFNFGRLSQLLEKRCSSKASAKLGTFSEYTKSQSPVFVLTCVECVYISILDFELFWTSWHQLPKRRQSGGVSGFNRVVICVTKHSIDGEIIWFDGRFI
jgi:hypothetical protein